MRSINLPGLIALLATVWLANVPVRAETALLMIEEKWCEWCDQWNSDIGVIYAKTPEGKIAPLRRADIHDPLPKDIALKTRVHYTPTFVLISDGHEVGRIEGYPGEDFFWGLLHRLLEKLPDQKENAGKKQTKPLRQALVSVEGTASLMKR